MRVEASRSFELPCVGDFECLFFQSFNGVDSVCAGWVALKMWTKIERVWRLERFSCWIFLPLLLHASTSVILVTFAAE